jgi:hypothetical protein
MKRAHNYNSSCSGRRQRGRNETFLQTTTKEVDKYGKSDSLIISRDINARVGNQQIPNIVGKK